MSHLRLVSAAPPPPESGFNARDLIALSCWMQRFDAHGYSRFLLEDGEDGSPADGGYALIYAPGQDWARWGVARNGAEIVVWHCGTGADHGRFGSMLAALDSLPPIDTRAVRRAMQLRRPPRRFYVVHPA